MVSRDGHCLTDLLWRWGSGDLPMDLVAWGADRVVLARYMQVVRDELCKSYEGCMIHIHHSFLPSFSGAQPYLQEHLRGVKLIGATFHYATADLDVGPIIGPEVVRVEHFHNWDNLVRLGQDC